MSTSGSGQAARALRIGVIGTGTIARQVHLPVLTSMPGVEVVWVSDANRESAAAVARAFGLDAVPPPESAQGIPDCDAVLLATPVGTRGPYLERLAERGIAVLAEKPFARTVEEHRSFAAPFAPHRIACGFMRRFYDSTAIVRSVIEDGSLGRLSKIVIREGGRTGSGGTDRSYFDDPRSGGGILLELGCHALDLAMQLTQATRHEIVRERFVFDGPTDRVAEGEVLLFGPGSIAGAAGLPLEFRFSWLDEIRNGLEVHFPAARLVVGNRPESVVRIEPAGGPAGGLAMRPGVGLLASGRGATTTNQAFYLEWRAFLDAIAGDRPQPLAAVTALPVTALIEDLYSRGRAASITRNADE